MNKQLNRLNQTRKLRQLLVVCALLLLPLGAWGQTTYYDLWVDGTRVNSSNASNVDGNNRVSFTPADGTNPAKLTLNDAVLTAPIIIGLSDLTFDIQGTNTITTSETCLKKLDGTDPSITFKSTSNNVGSLTLTHDGGVSEIGNVTISKELAPMLTVYGTEDYTSNMYYFTDGSTSVAKIVPSYGVKIGDLFIYSGNTTDLFGDGTPTIAPTVSFDKATSTLTLNNASIGESITGSISTSLSSLNIELVGNNTLTSGSYSTFQSLTGDPVTMKIQSTGTTKGCLMLNMSYSSTNVFTGNNVTLDITSPLSVVSGDLNVISGNTNIVMISEPVNYDLVVDNIKVVAANASNITRTTNNEGRPEVSFDASTNTLTLDNASLTGGIESGLANLTIHLKGTNTIALQSNATVIEATNYSRVDQSLTLTKEDATASLTISNITNTGNNNIAVNPVIWGFYTFDYATAGLSIISSQPTIYDWYTNYNIQGNPMSKALLGSIDKYYYRPTSVTFSSETVYPLWVAGTQVTESNKNNITRENTPRVSFTPASGNDVAKLTLSSANLSDKIISGVGSLNIHFSGDNVIDIATQYYDSAAVIRSVKYPSTDNAKLIFSADAGGTLEVKQSIYGNASCSVIKGFTSMVLGDGLYQETNAPSTYVGLVSGYGVRDIGLVESESLDLSQNYFIPIHYLKIMTNPTYPLWVNGNQVMYQNKDNILNDKTASVRFNPTTNTLSLYGANVQVTDDFVTSGLTGGLTVDLHGSSILNLGSTGTAFVSNITSNAVPLKFTTDASNPGQLSWTAGTLYKDFASPTCENELVLQSASNLISKFSITNYDLTIGTTVVNSVNCTNVLGDNSASIKYIDKDKTLVLDGAALTMPITSSLTELTIHLLGNNTISCDGDLLKSTVESAPLTFTTTPNTPGKLTLTKNTGAWISGFADPTYPSNYTKVEATNNMIFSLASTIKPIVVDKEDGTQPEAKEEMENPVETTGDGNTNKVINNVLYTVPKSDDSFINGTYGNPDAVCLGVAPTEVEVSEAQTEIPGTDAFASKFTGITFELPAGTGKVKVEAEIENGVKMAVKIGNNAAELFPKDASTYNVLTTYEVPYDVKVPTYVYVYLSETPAGARSEVRGRAKVMTGHIKVTTVGAVSNSMVMDDNYSEEDNVIKNDVKLFSLPEGAIQDGDKGVVLSEIKVDGDMKQITEIAPIVLVNLPNKDKIRYIDLTGTAIKDFTVNRSNATLSGLGCNTLIYMPDGNDDGGESNVIMNNVCASLSLASDNGFFVPTGFTANKAQLNRNFKAAQTSTIFLPFALSKTDADNLGTFHEFDMISGDNALFKDAITTGTEANTPYIFVPKTDVDNIAVANVNVPGAKISENNNGELVGTYEKITWDSEQTNYYGFAAVDEGTVSAGQFVRVDAGAWIPPFRAYLMVTETSPSRLNVVIAEGETTDLKEVKEVREVNDNRFYSISGQRVSQPSKGLYIINGKKVLVK